MNDLDTRIRAAMGAIVDATPPALAFEELQASIDRPSATKSPPSREGHRRWRRSVLAGAVGLITVASVAVVASVVPERSSTTPGHANTRTPPPSAGPAPVPAVVNGTEQTLGEVPVPADLASFSPPAVALVEGTQPFALSVDGTTPFAIVEVAADHLGDRIPVPYLAALTTGTLPIGGQGLGTQIRQMPLKDIEGGRPAVFSTWDFPTPTRRLDVWAHLPDGTAFVTLDYGDAGRLWQRPINGTVGFISTIPEPERSRYIDNPREPKLTAYDRSGNIVGEFVEPAHE